MIQLTLLAKSFLTAEAVTMFTKQARDDQFRGTDAERLTEIAGRICYDSFGKGRNSEEYHKHIRQVSHGSVLEHSTITILIQNVTRGLTHELIRHRVGTAVSQRSTRYDEDESRVIAHPLIRDMVCEMEDDDDLIEFSSALEEHRQQNRKLYREVVQRCEQFQIDKGVDKATARKQARGAARGFLENGMETELVFTMNLRAVLNIISQRGVGAADAEIREFALKLLEIAKTVAPAYFNHIKVRNGEIVTKGIRI